MVQFVQMSTWVVNFSDIPMILSTFIQSPFKLFPPQQVIQKDRILSITDL